MRWPLGTAALWLSRRHRASAGTGGTRPLWPGPGWPKAAAWATLSGHQGAAEAGRSLAPRRRRLHFAGLRRRCAGGWVKELWVDAWAAASQGTLPCLGLLVSRPCCGQKPHMRGQAMRISAGAGAPERLRLQAPPLCHAAHISFRSSHLPSAAGCVLPGEQGHAGEQRRGDVWSVCVEHVVEDGRGVAGVEPGEKSDLLDAALPAGAAAAGALDMSIARRTREPSSSSTTSAGTSSAPLQLWPPAALLGLALPCRLMLRGHWRREGSRRVIRG